MAIFRVYGFRAPGESESILVECDSEAVARNAAIREGFTNTTKVELVEGQVGEDVTRVPRLNPGRGPADLTKFQRQPVWTIAQGVFVGLAMWTLFMTILAAVFSYLD